MGIEELKTEILEEAGRQCNELLSRAKIEIEKLEEEYTARKKEEQKKFDEDVKKQVEEMKRREVYAAEMEGRNSLFRIKKEALKTLARNVEDQLAGLSKDERKKLLINLLSRASKEIHVSRIFCNRQDMEIIRDMLKKEQLTAELIESKELTGGIIAENSDSSIRVDYSYASMLDVLKEKHFAEIGGLVFG